MTTTLLHNARLLTGDSRPPSDGGQIRIVNGTIVEVGTAASTGPADHLVDLGGRTVMPALIDAHGHIGYMRGSETTREFYSRENVLDHLRRLAYYGVGVFQSLGTDRNDTELAIRNDQRDGTLDDPDLATLMTTGVGVVASNPDGVNSGPYFAVDVVREVSSPKEATRVVREIATKEPDGIKLWVDNRDGATTALDEPTFRALIAEAKEHGLRTMAHVYYLQDAKALVSAGVDALAHMVRAPGPDDELITMMAEQGTAGFTSMSAQNSARDLGWLDDPALAETVPALVRAESAAFLAGLPSSMPSLFDPARFAVLEESLQRYIDGGVKIIFSADSGALGGFLGYSAHRELEAMVRAGMDPLQAIRIATADTADFLGLADRGRIAIGKRADLVVLDGDPLAGIRNTRRITDVYLGGRTIDREGMRTCWLR